MPVQESSWPGLPRLALGIAVLAAEQLRLIDTSAVPAADPAVVPAAAPFIGPARYAHEPAGPVLPGGAIMPEGPTSPIGFAERVGMRPVGTDGAVIPDAVTLRPPSSPYAVAVGLAQEGLDLAQQGVQRARNTRDQLLEAARSRAEAARARAARVTGGPGGSPADRARGVVGNAGVRGQQTIESSRAAALDVLRSAVDSGVSWAETSIVPRMVDDLMPYLINSVVPRLVEGAIPEIRTKVLPVVIDDLTTDPRIRALVTEQGRGMLTDASEELRTTSATADDAVEAGFRRLFHLSGSTGDR